LSEKCCTKWAKCDAAKRSQILKIQNSEIKGHRNLIFQKLGNSKIQKFWNSENYYFWKLILFYSQTQLF
jgi:hypothetical protein